MMGYVPWLKNMFLPDFFFHFLKSIFPYKLIILTFFFSRKDKEKPCHAVLW